MIPRAVTTPAIDWLCVGGASIGAIALLAALGPAAAQSSVLGGYVILSFLINWPHFMASYHLLYTTPGATANHPFATMYVPAFLVVYAVAAAALCGRAPALFNVFHAVAAMYLAWHYTGQAWGMMAAFSRVEGVRFDALSRGLVRANLLALLVWHATWSAHIVSKMIGPARFMPIYQAVSAAAAASAALGVLGLWLLYRSAGRLPWTVLLPWVAIHLWYAVLYWSGAMYWVFVVQFAHALQYLIFPIRVHENLRPAPRARGSFLKRSAVYYAGLAASGFAAFWLAPHVADALSARFTAALPAGIVGILIGDVLVIHHYFVDGCIWKLENKKVHHDLLSHLGADQALGGGARIS